MSSLPAHLTQTQLQRIEGSVDLGALIGQHTQLRPAGKDTLVGRCCFHKERTGSLKVHPQAGYYKCFGCGAHGGAITFTMRMDGLSFLAAARLLADQYGVSLTEVPRHVTREQLAMATQVAAKKKKARP